MIWTIDLTNVSMWYYLIIGIFIIVGIIGTWIHNSAIPITWAVLMSIILFFGSTTLEPLIFGFQYYTMYSFQWIMVSLFGVLFALINLTYGYNILTKGTVVE